MNVALGVYVPPRILNLPTEEDKNTVKEIILYNDKHDKQEKIGKAQNSIRWMRWTIEEKLEKWNQLQ